MTTTALTQEQRAESLQAMSTETFDVLVIGGGVTGAGIALDAASRGLSTAVIECQDWASGTSSRSSRLVHGGLRYLYNLDFKLVAGSRRGFIDESGQVMHGQFNIATRYGQVDNAVRMLLGALLGARQSVPGKVGQAAVVNAHSPWGGRSTT